MDLFAPERVRFVDRLMAENGCAWHELYRNIENELEASRHSAENVSETKVTEDFNYIQGLLRDFNESHTDWILAKRLKEEKEQEKKEEELT